MERKQQPSHSIKDGAGFNQGWLFTNNKREGEVKVGHKAKPIKPFLRQNKNSVFQYATVERDSNELKCVGCTNTAWLQAHGEQQAPHLRALSNPHRKVNLFDHVTRQDHNRIRHLKLENVNIHTAPSPPNPPQHAHVSPAWERPSILKTLLGGKHIFWSVKSVRKVWTGAVFGSACTRMQRPFLGGWNRGLLPQWGGWRVLIVLRLKVSSGLKSDTDPVHSF